MKAKSNRRQLLENCSIHRNKLYTMGRQNLIIMNVYSTAVTGPYCATASQELTTSKRECLKMLPKTSRNSDESLEIFRDAIPNCWTRTAESMSFRAL